MKSLVAEDDATNRKLLQTYLTQCDTCDVALYGKQAVDAVRLARQNHQSYDLVYMDLRMPVTDGQEAIRWIRKQKLAAGVAKPAQIDGPYRHGRHYQGSTRPLQCLPGEAHRDYKTEEETQNPWFD
ncbi:MAG: response regulator [Terracidiphilus sp.]|jgi:CheY-like chemotaxis protein